MGSTIFFASLSVMTHLPRSLIIGAWSQTSVPL